MPLPDVVVDRSSPVPLYFQVAEQLERAILDGELAPGDRIANEIALADQLGLSRPDHASGHPDPGGQGHAGAQARRRHPGRARRRSAARSSSPASTTT